MPFPPTPSPQPTDHRPPSLPPLQITPLPSPIYELVAIDLEEGLYIPALTILTNLLHSHDSTRSDPAVPEITIPPPTSHDASIPRRTTSLAPGRRLFMPPPQLLALLLTLSIHPSMTSGQSKPLPTVSSTANGQKRSASTIHHTASLSLSYLLSLLSLVGANPILLHAFTFSPDSYHAPRSFRSLRARHNDSSDAESPANILTAGGNGVTGQVSYRPLQHRLAGVDSLVSVAQDFWACVGWTFNLASKSADPDPEVARLERERARDWAAWLEMMLTVLEASWRQRDGQAEDRRPHSAGSDAQDGEETVPLIIGCIRNAHNNRRRIVRSIFARGEPSHLAEFGRIWSRECVKPKIKESDAEQKAKEQKVDIENDIYGDYYASDESGGADDEVEGEKPETLPRRTASGRSLRPRRSNRSLRGKKPDADMGNHNGYTLSGGDPNSSAAQSWGGVAILKLRLRLIDLLASVALHMPDQFLEYGDFVDHLVDVFKIMPLPEFQIFLTSPMLHSQQAVPWRLTLFQMYLTNTVGSQAPGHSWIVPNHLARPPASQSQGPDVSDGGHNQLDSDRAVRLQLNLEKCYLPFSAPTSAVLDQARLSLVLEALVQDLIMKGLMKPSKTLSAYVRAGVKAREGKVRASERVKSSDTWDELLASGTRLRDLAKLAG